MRVEGQLRIGMVGARVRKVFWQALPVVGQMMKETEKVRKIHGVAGLPGLWASTACGWGRGWGGECLPKQECLGHFFNNMVL